MILGKIEVSGINARTVYRKAIPKGIVGATVEIEYADPIWDSLTKTVVFWGCCVKDVVNPGQTVKIPAEVVDAAGYRLRVGVYGVDAENNLVIPTLWADLGNVEYSADPSGDESTDPQLPVWAQLEDDIVGLKKQIGDLNELETEDNSSLVAAVNEVRNKAGNSSDSSQNGDGLTSTEKSLILSLFKNAAYTADMSGTIAQLETLWGGGEEPDEPVVPEVTLASISATYSGGSVPVGTAASSLTGVKVTAHYSDGSTATVTGYTLSGTIKEGTNTITVSYGGKTTTFTVTGVADESGGDDSGGSEATGNEHVVVTGATATDDGNGNVTVIGMTATDDGNGNITVS